MDKTDYMKLTTELCEDSYNNLVTLRGQEVTKDILKALRKLKNDLYFLDRNPAYIDEIYSGFLLHLTDFLTEQNKLLKVN